MNPMKSKRAIWWGIAMALVLGGVFVMSVLLPSQTKPAESSQPEVHVPAMRNVPDQSGRRLDLEVPPEKP